MSSADPGRPRAVVFGCSGPALTADEQAFFAKAQPLGFILFANNCESPDQIRALVRQLREAVGRPRAPVLIDQEGGRVARLRPPHWKERPPAKVFADLAGRDAAAASEAARINARLIAADLADLGIDVDCAPVVDVPIPDGHDIIGDRAHGDTPELVSLLGRAVCDGLLAGGVMPVIKHIPGHGRARSDSHIELPVVDAPLDELRRTDFRPFADLAAMPCAMVAHVLYTAVDAALPATTSTTVIDEVIRGDIGFDGLLYSDDLSMEALAGTLAERAAAVVGAGCDVALYCGGVIDEMRAVAEAAGPLSDAAMDRVARAEASVGAPDGADIADLEARLEQLLAPATD